MVRFIFARSVIRYEMFSKAFFEMLSSIPPMKLSHKTVSELLTFKLCGRLNNCDVILVTPVF